MPSQALYPPPVAVDQHAIVTVRKIMRPGLRVFDLPAGVEVYGVSKLATLASSSIRLLDRASLESAPITASPRFERASHAGSRTIASPANN